MLSSDVILHLEEIKQRNKSLKEQAVSAKDVNIDEELQRQEQERTKLLSTIHNGTIDEVIEVVEGREAHLRGHLLKESKREILFSPQTCHTLHECPFRSNRLGLQCLKRSMSSQNSTFTKLKSLLFSKQVQGDAKYL